MCMYLLHSGERGGINEEREKDRERKKEREIEREKDRTTSGALKIKQHHVIENR